MKHSYFILGIFLAIFFARLAPSIGNVGGILKPEITVKYIAVSVIFLCSGLSLPTEELTGTFFRWDLHLFVQGFTFFVFPAIVYCLVWLLQKSFFHPAMLEGITILSTMPPPVSSAIIVTKAVGGNEAAAVFNSAFGSMLGIFLTPFLIILLIGASEVEVPTERIFQQLFITVVIPLVIGQMFRNYNYRWLIRQKIPFSTIGQFMIYLIIYATFCATFSRPEFELDTFTLVSTVLLIFCLQLVIMTLLLHTSSSSILGFESADSVTVTFCGTHKSLTLGIPVIDIIFEGNPNISFLSIPLLIYNPLQIIVGALSVPLLKEWLNNQKNKRRKDASLWHHV